jgi:hypothetical protein
MGCPFIDKRYGQICCDATDGYIEWENYSCTCNDSWAYMVCDNYKRESSKPEKVNFISSYQI